MKLLNDSSKLTFRTCIEDIKEIKEKIKSAKTLFNNVIVEIYPHNCEIDYNGYSGTINHNVEVEKIGNSWIYIKHNKYTKVQPYGEFILEIKYK